VNLSSRYALSTSTSFPQSAELLVSLLTFARDINSKLHLVPG
jgi:hypothetical protein